MEMLNEIHLVVLDIDGVFYCKNGAVLGAREAIAMLRKSGLIIRFLTNDAFSSRFSRAQELNTLGFDVHPSDIYTAASLTADYLRLLGSPPTMLLVEGECSEEFKGIPIVDHDPQVVVVGDCFSSYNFDKLNHAFSSIRNGAHFIAMQKNRHCSIGGEPLIDVGFWVAGLEYCTAKHAEVIGKPSVSSYVIICQDAGIAVENAAMVSDDLSSDLVGAHHAGLLTIHVTDYWVPSSLQPFFSPDLVVPDLNNFAEQVYRKKPLI
jgi:HAD superfamily hydrolase (TIGR01458 family)